MVKESAWYNGFPLSPSACDWSWLRDKVCKGTDKGQWGQIVEKLCYGYRNTNSPAKCSVLCGGKNVQPSWGCWNETTQDITNKDTNPENVYTELVSKNSSETYKSCTLQTKVVPVFTCPLAGKRCPVHLLDLYFSNLPEEAFKQDTLFVRPLETYLLILPNHGIAMCQLVRTYLKPNWVQCVHLQKFKSNKPQHAYNLR